MATKQLIIVPHCFISDDFSPVYNDETKEIFDVVRRFNVKLIQLPCPRLLFMSLVGTKGTWPTNLYSVLKTTDDSLLKMVYFNSLTLLLAQIQKYKNEGISLAGIVGVEGSPTCQACHPSPTIDANTGLFLSRFCQILKEKDFIIGTVNLRFNTKKRQISKLEKNEKM